MVRLSVNVNKVATLRNARGGAVPSVLEAVETCIAAGAPGITVHPRADRRHITPDDVRAIARLLRGKPEKIELNVEGDPRPSCWISSKRFRPISARSSQWFRAK
jgi:pyridoxine 5-phosphate synthase